jgi:DNA polymerase-3 subunit chi
VKQVEFHTGVADPFHYACRLLRKAYRKGARVAVLAPAQTAGALDRALWLFEEREFVPHLRVDPAAPRRRLAARTPIWLIDGAWPADAPPVVVSIDADMPGDLEPIERLIEIVGQDPDAAARARARWRVYRERGVPVVHHSEEPR